MSKNDKVEAYGHQLKTVEGNFQSYVWKCMNCNEIRTHAEWYENIDCPP